MISLICGFQDMTQMNISVAQTAKRLPAVQETRVQSLDWEDPLEKKMAAHYGTLPGKFRGWRSLVGYSPWGHKESDMTERLHWFTGERSRLTDVQNRLVVVKGEGQIASLGLLGLTTTNYYR